MKKYIELEWNRLNNVEKKRFIKTFKIPLYIMIAITILYFTFNFVIAPTLIEYMK